MRCLTRWLRRLIRLFMVVILWAVVCRLPHLVRLLWAVVGLVVATCLLLCRLLILLFISPVVVQILQAQLPALAAEFLLHSLTIMWVRVL